MLLRSAVVIVLNWFYNNLYFLVLGQGDFLHSRSSSAWPHADHALDEDSSGLDYMLALSLQSDGDSRSGGVEGNVWSDIWDHKIGKSNTPLANNNYPDFTVGSSSSTAQDQDQTGELLFTGNTKLFSCLFTVSNCFCRYHAALWILRRAVSRRRPHFTSGLKMLLMSVSLTLCANLYWTLGLILDGGKLLSITQLSNEPLKTSAGSQNLWWTKAAGWLEGLLCVTCIQIETLWFD